MINIFKHFLVVFVKLCLTGFVSFLFVVNNGAQIIDMLLWWKVIVVKVPIDEILAIFLQNSSLDNLSSRGYLV